MSAFDIPMIVLFFCKYVSKNVGTFGHPNLFNIDHPDGDNCTKNSNMRGITVYDVMTEVNKILHK